MDRTIEVKVSGNYITKDNKNAGVRGEANVTNLRISFSEDWSGYAKKITFWDASGTNHVVINLAIPPLNVIVESTRIFIVPIPPEAMAEAGMMTFVVEGYEDGKRQRAISAELKVHDAPYNESALEPSDVTPSQAELLQGQIERIIDDMQAEAITAVNAKNAAETAKIAAETAEMAAETAESGAISAKEEAETAKANAETAQGAAQTAQTNAEAAQEAAETAQGLAETAQSSAETAQRKAETAQGNAENAQSLAEVAQQKAETAQGLAEAAQEAAEIVQSNAKTAQRLAETAQAEAEEARDDILNMTVSAEQLLSSDNPCVTKTEQDGVVNLHFGIPDGEKGNTGDSGVYIGSDEPTDPYINVWINPNGGENVLRIKNDREEWEDIPSIKGDKGDVLYASFDIDTDSGELEMTTPEAYKGIGFELNNKGELEVIING